MMNSTLSMPSRLIMANPHSKIIADDMYRGGVTPPIQMSDPIKIITGMNNAALICPLSNFIDTPSSPIDEIQFTTEIRSC
jgi:hypothetical protein